MCLSKVSKKYKAEEARYVSSMNAPWGVGCKILKVGEKRWSAPIMMGYRSKVYDKWYKDVYNSNIHYNGSSAFYESGFHIFETLEDAKQALSSFPYKNKKGIQIVKVLYQGVVAKGTQYGVNVVVAKAICVPNPNGKKKVK